MKVFIPSPLRNYTNEQSEVDASGSSLAELLNDLDMTYPGIRFRIIDEQDQIRQHIKIFINQLQVKDVNQFLNKDDKVLIVCALSGG